MGHEIAGRGPGRPPRGPRSSERHETRPRLDPRWPVHVVVRSAPGSRLRGHRGWGAVRHALRIAARRADFRICQVSIQSSHLHAIVEADDRIALARGMQGFQIALARRFNAISRRRGALFPDRYHAVALRRPRQVRGALAHVLNNWRRHGEDAGSPLRWDPFSSARAFDGWTSRPPPPGEPDDVVPVVGAATWLMTIGWRRHGLIAPRERPG